MWNQKSIYPELSRNIYNCHFAVSCFFFKFIIVKSYWNFRNFNISKIKFDLQPKVDISEYICFFLNSPKIIDFLNCQQFSLCQICQWVFLLRWCNDHTQIQFIFRKSSVGTIQCGILHCDDSCYDFGGNFYCNYNLLWQRN